MTIRYTYFKAQPRGFCVYDEITHRSIAYFETAHAAIRHALKLNHTTDKWSNKGNGNNGGTVA